MFSRTKGSGGVVRGAVDRKQGTHWGAAIPGWLPGMAWGIGTVSFGLPDLLP